MKIAHISYTTPKTAAWVRLMKALKLKGIDGSLLTEHTLIKSAIYPNKSKFLMAQYRRIKRKLFNYRFPRKKSVLPFTDALFSQPLFEKFDIDANIIHLNWIADRFVDLESLERIDKPIIWTLHDAWPLTGGCHYNFECQKWLSGCDYCVLIESSVSALFWKNKLNAIQCIKKLTIVTPSNWLGEMVQQSPIFAGKKIEVIPNCIDTNLFKPLDHRTFRKLLSLPTNKKVIVFGAVNAINVAYKGFDLLVKALQILKSKGNNDIHLLVFGADKEESSFYNLPFEATFLGNLVDEIALVSAYNCADVFVGPSRQDNLPGTFIEAAACGVPSVGFAIGGIPEICIHKQTGYLARPFEVEDLANGIEWVIEDFERWSILSRNSREKAIKDYSMEVVAGKYIALYDRVLNANL